MFQVRVARVDVGVLSERGVVVPRPLLMIEIGTPACSIRVKVVCLESCKVMRRRPARLSRRAVARDKPVGDVGGHPAIMADVEEVEVVVAHQECATLRVGELF